MKVISIAEGYARIFRRWEKLSAVNADRFRVHANGFFAHIGEISPSCVVCLRCVPNWTIELGADVGLPNVCNRDCDYCAGIPSARGYEQIHTVEDYRVPPEWRLTSEWKDTIRKSFASVADSQDRHFYVFAGPSEPLLYMPVIREYLRFCREEIDDIMGARGWAKVYTNGVLLDLDTVLELADLGVDEIKVNPAADRFSSEVFANLKKATRHISTVTVDAAAWPPNRDQLLDMLPVIEDLGVKHLSVTQVRIWHRRHLEKIGRVLPEAEVFQCYDAVVDDGGLTFDVMKEVLDKGYTFSVMDCNCFTHLHMYLPPHRKEVGLSGACDDLFATT